MNIFSGFFKSIAMALFLAIVFALASPSVAFSLEQKKDIEPATSAQYLEIEEGQDFKILTVTDSHIDGIRSRNFLLDALKKLINEHDPDLIVFDGDNVDHDTDLIYFDKVAQFLEEKKIYWAAVMGNHDRDRERDGYPKGLFAQNTLLQRYNSFNKENGYCLYVESEYGYEEQLDYNNYPREGNEWSRAKIGNYAVNIKNGDDIAYSLIFLDSGQHRAPYSEENGYIEQFQVDWYQEYITDISMDQLGVTELEEDQYIPSMIFTHQPILEYIDAAAYALDGNYKGYIPQEYGFGYLNSIRGGTQNLDYNYGLFDAMKSVGGTHIFVGHLHKNSSNILYEDIWLSHLTRVGRRGGEGKDYPYNKSTVSTLITIDGATNEVDLCYALPNGITTKDIDEAHELNK